MFTKGATIVAPAAAPASPPVIPPANILAPRFANSLVAPKAPAIIPTIAITAIDTAVYAFFVFVAALTTSSCALSILVKFTRSVPAALAIKFLWTTFNFSKSI